MEFVGEAASFEPPAYSVPSYYQRLGCVHRLGHSPGPEILFTFLFSKNQKNMRFIGMSGKIGIVLYHMVFHASVWLSSPEKTAW